MIKLLAKPLAEEMEARIAERASEFHARHGRRPKLQVVIVGHDPASVIYVRKKGETAARLGLESETATFNADAPIEKVRATIERFNQDPAVDGILIQRPLPKAFEEREVMYWVDPEKDVDAFHPVNVGRLALGQDCFKPCTPAGVMELLKHYGITVAGKIACVIGRSAIVGKPMAQLLLQADATVIHCHSRTPDLASLTRQAEILVVAAGRRHLINGSHVRDGAVVVDVGIHRDGAGRITGDIDFESAAAKASAITPVPGGVGPMTIAMLLSNTVWSAERKTRDPSGS